MPGILEPFNHIAWSKMYASFPCIDLGEGVHCVDPDGLEQTFTIKLEDVLAFVTGAPSWDSILSQLLTFKGHHHTHEPAHVAMFFSCH